MSGLHRRYLLHHKARDRFHARMHIQRDIDTRSVVCTASGQECRHERCLRVIQCSGDVIRHTPHEIPSELQSCCGVSGESEVPGLQFQFHLEDHGQALLR